MAMKRANGTGTVYKMSGKRRKPYRAMVTLGYDEMGKAMRKTIGTFAKASEAQKALYEYLGDPSAYDAKGVTLETVWNWLLEDKDRQGIQYRKQSRYNAFYKMTKHLHHFPIADIKLAQLQLCFDQTQMAASTLNNIKTVLTNLYDIAIKNGVVDKNIAKYISLPAPQKSTMHKPFSNNEIRTLWSNSDMVLAQVTLSFIYTGLRPGELYGIKSCDVHIDKQYMIGGNKTKAGKDRIIPIHNAILPFIKMWLKNAKTNNADLLMQGCEINSIPTYRYRLNHAPSDFGCHKPHDGRHTFATMAYGHRMDSDIIKRIMGHSRATDITSDVYIHTDLAQLLEAVNILPYGQESCLYPE